MHNRKQKVNEKHINGGSVNRAPGQNVTTGLPTSPHEPRGSAPSPRDPPHYDASPASSPDDDLTHLIIKLTYSSPRSLRTCRLRLELALEPAAVEPIFPERTLFSVRSGVSDACALGRDTIDAAPHGGILLPSLGAMIVRGRRMRASTVRTTDGLSFANRRIVAPPHAPSALGGSGPRRGAADLTKPASNRDLLTNEASGIAARD